MIDEIAVINNPQEHWTKVAQSTLVGRKIVGVRYLSDREVERLGWTSRSVIFELDNGCLVWPTMDDEGNDAGAIFTTDLHGHTLPVIRVQSGEYA